MSSTVVILVLLYYKSSGVGSFSVLEPTPDKQKRKAKEETQAFSS